MLDKGTRIGKKTWTHLPCLYAGTGATNPGMAVVFSDSKNSGGAISDANGPGEIAFTRMGISLVAKLVACTRVRWFKGSFRCPIGKLHIIVSITSREEAKSTYRDSTC